MRERAPGWGVNKTMQWRLLLDGPASGAWNMAVDEAILTSHARGAVAPTLRFYSWEPACLSLGRLQAWESVPALRSGAEGRPSMSEELNTLEKSCHGGFDVVRRPTGGRAVWHQHEVTYSAVIRLELLPPGETSVMSAYRLLSGGLNAGLRDLGVPVELSRCGTRAANANCFTANAACDSAVDGRKLVGAAQFRHGDALLQHGSILTEIDYDAWNAALPGSMDGAVSLAFLGVRLGGDRIAEALAAAFATTLGVEMVLGGLTPEERELANRLQCFKYGTNGWTRNRGLPARRTEEVSRSGEPLWDGAAESHPGVCSAVMAEV